MRFRLAVATEDFGDELRAAILSAARQQSISGLRLNARTEVRPGEFSETALRQLRLLVQEHQLQVAGLIFPTRHALQETEHLEQRLEGIRRTLPMVRKLGTTELLLRVGRIPDPADTGAVATSAPTNDQVDSLLNPFSYAPATTPVIRSSETPAGRFAMLRDILSDLAAQAGREGVILQLILSQFHAERMRQLQDTVTSGPLQFVLDPAACIMSGANPVQLFRDHFTRFGYVRLRDALVDVDGAGTEVPLGDGNADWPELLATVVESGYSGWMCLERLGGDQRAADVQLGLERLQPLLPARGT
jgi:sugar phosphate isomerase/epimerase